ncbi:SIR2 family protein [Thalassospira sp. SM2505]
MKKHLEIFKRSFVKEIENGTAAVFAGAGLSLPAGFVNWKELLRPIAEGIKLSVDREDDLVTLAQFHLNENKNNRYELTQTVIEEFSKQAKITENHEILARLPIGTFWTTNYDKLIETALEQSTRLPDVKFTVEHLAQTRPNRNAVVYKMHGDISLPHQVILTRNDYESYHINFQPFITALSGDLVDKTFIFIGFSFSDPNLEYVLSRIRTTFANNQRKHYCFLKSVDKLRGESDEDFEYRKRRHDLIVADLLNYNIHALEIDDYSDVTEVLSEVEKSYRRRTVFISGSASEYGVWETSRAEQFLCDIGRKLVESGFKVVTGMGLGVGNFVVAGALDQIYMKQNAVLHDQIVMRPFPQGEDVAQLWEAYRQDMTSYAGISIFVFGNKCENGTVVEAVGVEREFQIAREKAHTIIPVGATGYVAEKLWNRVKENFEDFFPNATDDLKSEFEILGDKSKGDDALLASLVRMLKSLA